jgi:hypothetical protein
LRESPRVATDEFQASIFDEDAIFHYTGREVALEEILYRDCFRFSSLTNANDPYEYKSKMIGAGGWSWNGEVERKAQEVCRVLDRLLSEHVYYVSCCSNTFENTVIRDRGYEKSRMWSQYGESHKGICLALSKHKLVNLVTKGFPQSEYSCYHGSVSYREHSGKPKKYGSVRIDHDTFVNITPFELAVCHLEKYYGELLLSKERDYQDEREYRVVLLRKELDPEQSTIPEFRISDCLIGVILGDRFPKVYLPAIRRLSEKMGFEYRKLHWEARQYFLLRMDE